MFNLFKKKQVQKIDVIRFQAQSVGTGEYIVYEIIKELIDKNFIVFLNGQEIGEHTRDYQKLVKDLCENKNYIIELKDNINIDIEKIKKNKKFILETQRNINCDFNQELIETENIYIENNKLIIKFKE